MTICKNKDHIRIVADIGREYPIDKCGYCWCCCSKINDKCKHHTQKFPFEPTSGEVIDKIAGYKPFFEGEGLLPYNNFINEWGREHYKEFRTRGGSLQRG